MITRPTSIKYYIPTAIEQIDSTAEPTLVGITGEDYLGNSIAAGGQAINAMDGYPKRPVQANTDGVATTWRIDVALQNRIRSDFALIDGHNLRDAYPAAVKDQIDIYHHYSDSFAAATKITPDSIFGGLLGKKRPYIDLDGVNDYVLISDNAQLDPGLGDYTIFGRIYMPDVSGDVVFAYRYQDANNYFYIKYDQTAGVLDCQFAIGGGPAHQAKCAWSPSANTWYDIVWVIDNGVSNALYIDQTAQTLTTDSYTGGDISMAAALKFGWDNSTYYQQYQNHWIFFKSALSASNVTNLPYSTGAAAEYSPEGINKQDGKWYDSSGNGNHGTINNAEYKNIPYDSDRGFCLAEFSEVDRQYWFINFNEDGKTGTTGKNAFIGQVVIGKIYDINGYVVDGGYGGEYSYPGIITKETDSGNILTERRYGLRPNWTINFAPSSDTQFEDLMKMLDVIQNALFPFYICFNHDQNQPIIWRVRLKGGLKWNYMHGSEKPWKQSIELISDI